MANQQRSSGTQNIFQRLFSSVQTFLIELFQEETWHSLWEWCLWRIIPKRRRVFQMMQELPPLHPDAPPDMRAIREEVFARSALELQRTEDIQILLDVLKKAHEPIGYEQIFFAAIYPVLLKRDMAVIPIETEEEHRLDVEIGYLGHNEDYFFWVLEIDGKKRLTLDTPLEPREEVREDKRYVVYPLGSNGFIDVEYAEYVEQWLLDAPRFTTVLPSLTTDYAEQWVLSARVYISHILADLRNRNYQVTAAAIPDFERARLSLLHRLSLDRL